ncbi:30S ribosomal protein S1 [Candidatus Falkowbacteria bacterium CG11_big_fil_rev_8_21_14_0_20_39_10]|uniref:30S ribosomal protein S1 n=1 Tax=Candidatus Falkowbacteria bacterium CG11_big_fil_rev_8_21_14_0_20_39_10 TaxID=1974570 RepID=A0A2M6K8A7_9BACT|nr:MAG: 30S ribosomal protein S1 [Candidatus Falkowbacteria bacterium CG11_big_fil_rev_8_21_14_0_20_39_10]
MKEKDTKSNSEFQKLLDKDSLKIPVAGDIVKGAVISASKAEVKLDIDGVLIGVIRGPELYDEDPEYSGLKPGDEIEATVIEEDNENGELELSFRSTGQEKAWINLEEAFKDKKTIKVKIAEANKGGLLAKYKQIAGFLPVSQLAPENYPRVSGGDRSKILEKLKSFIGREFDVQVITLDENENKIIFSEKNLWSEKQKDVISKYKIGTQVEGKITAVTDFGVFINFGENMEGLIHISELAWQRIDRPSDLYKTGDKIKAEVINLDGSKIFLSAKKLMKDPWEKAAKKYEIGKIFTGEILKVNPFGLFVKLDDDIHGLAHISQLGLTAGQKIDDLFKAGDKADFVAMSVEPKEHRLGLKLVKKELGSKNQEAGKKAVKKDEDKKTTKKDKDEKGENTKTLKKDKKEEREKKDSGKGKKGEKKETKKKAPAKDKKVKK